MSLKVEIYKKLSGFTLDVKLNTENDFRGILGASGSGKSITLKCIAGIMKPDRGHIELNGTVLYDSETKINLPPQKRNIGYLFQDYALFPNMTVLQNIGIGVKASKQEKEKKVLKQVADMQLNGLESRYPHELSGGQKQRVALARILASDPDVLLLDEPFSALDAHLKEKLQIQLAKDLVDFGRDILMVSHSRDEIYKLCETMSVFDEGSVIHSGNTRDLFSDPQSVKVARLTGCKNISRVKAVSQNGLIAEDWKISLKFEGPVDPGTTHVGIRAHDLAADAAGAGGFKTEVIRFLEDPFEMNVVLANRESEKKNQIWWKVPKKEWIETFHGQVPEYLSFPAEKLMLLWK